MNNKKNKNINKIIITASGGPFYKRDFNSLKNIKFSQAIKHPKWKMGYKNSIDSATLVNKCLELIEAHYLFEIPFNKIDILIHPQAIVHSLIEYKNFITQLNSFKNDMKIPIINFLLNSKSKFINIDQNLFVNDYSQLDFHKVKKNIFPIYNFFKNIDKTNPQNLIKFNIEMNAVNLYKNNIIKYTIFTELLEVISLNLYSSLNTIKDIIIYHEEIESKLPKL